MNREIYDKPKWIPVVLIRLLCVVLLCIFPVTLLFISITHFCRKGYAKDIFSELVNSVLAKYE